MKLKKYIFGIVGVLICILFTFVLKAPDSLEIVATQAGSDGTAAMAVLGITIFAIAWWIGEVTSDWLTAIVMMVLWVVIGKVPFSLAFSSYASTSVWLIIGAFCLATSITKTGLFQRISYFLMKTFSPTYKGQALALLIVGTITSPLIPSITTKAILGGTMANNIANTMGYGPDSRERYGIFMASWFGFSLSACAFKTGSIQGYTLFGALPSEVSSNLSFISWFIAMMPWLIVYLVCSYFYIKNAYKPREEKVIKNIKKENEFVNLSKKEAISAGILTFAVIFWMLENILNIDASITALIAAFLCFFLNILDAKEISTAVPWNFVIFLGSVLSLGKVFSMVGLDIWMQNFISPIFNNFNNIYVIVIVIIIAVILVRSIIVSQNATIIILLTILSPVMKSLGVSPFIVGIIIFTAQAFWFIPYQNLVLVGSIATMNGTVEFKKTVRASYVYEIINLIAILASIPFWKVLGYM